MSRLTEFERAAESLRLLAVRMAREVLFGPDANFLLLSAVATDLARQADRLAGALSEFDAVLGEALQWRAKSADGDLLQALAPSRRRTAGGA